MSFARARKCPLTIHRRNKHKFGKIFKIQLFEVDIKRRIETVAMDNYIFRFAAYVTNLVKAPFLAL